MKRLVIMLAAFLAGAVWFGLPQQVHGQTACPFEINGWRQVSSSPAFHIEGASAAVDGRFYLFTGFADNNLVPNNRLDVYNPATDTWETVANPRGPMPTSASHIQGVVEGQFVWLAGGFTGPHPGPPTDQVWRYDTVSDLWTAGPALPAPRASGALVIQGRTLHYIGGLDATRDDDQDNHWILDLDNPVAWASAAPLPVARNHLNGVFVGGQVLAIGGQFRHDTNPQDVNLLHAFDPAAGAWTQRADLPGARSHFEPSTLFYGDSAIIIGGRNNQAGQAALDDVTVYDATTDTWRELTPLPVALIAPFAEIINNQIIVTAGGFDYNDGQTETWITDIVDPCAVAALAVVAAPPAPPNIIISKSGALETGAAGRTGDIITWTILVRNDGSAQQDVTVTDTIAAALALIDVRATRGTVDVAGRAITVEITPLWPGESATITIETRIVTVPPSGAIDNTVAVPLTGASSSASVRLLPPVTSLPATGERTDQRVIVLAALTSGLIILLSLGMMLRRARRAG